MTPHFGWIPIEERDVPTQVAVERLLGEWRGFAITGQSWPTEGRTALLWEFTRKVNGGRDLPAWAQEIGDCVSMGAANAVNYLACMEIARLGDRERFQPAFPPYIYGTSRVQVGGGRIQGDGSIGAWAAEALKAWGVLHMNEKNVPRYSGSIARQWGRGGPPEEFIKIAKPHLVRSAAVVTSFEQVRDAIANGYPVTVASRQGFRGELGPAFGQVDRGKRWGVPGGTWNHQMCFIGVDDDPARPGCYCMNSWGSEAMGRPEGGEPPGGFWIDASVVTRMVREGDSFAFSQFDGFPEQELDFLLVG